MNIYIDDHIKTIRKKQADTMQHVCETGGIPAKELVRLQKEYTDLQITVNWLEQMKHAIQPAMIVPAGPGGLQIVN